ncbi:MAG: ABC transporter ATP-binding protein [Thermodesulfobacteriota bacterium]
MAAILKLENVTKTFGRLAAVADLSFAVEQGEIFGIAGPNGAGKTTLFNVITGFYQGGGRILFQGRKIDGLRPDQITRRGIARTFQVPALFASMTIFQNVRVGAYFGGGGAGGLDGRVEEALAAVGLAGKGHLPAAGLKLIDKKLTMLAAVLATRPKLLLLDEPIAGLSPLEAEGSVALIRKINRELGVTIIVIEHLMRVLTDISGRLMILHNGERICLGPPREVVQDPRVIEVYLGARHA